MHTRRLSLTLLTTCFLPLVAAAQVIGAAGEDARVAPRGTVGISVGGAWSRWSERFGRLTTSGADGSAVPLGSNFNIDSLGPRQVESLLGAQQSIRALAATPGFSATLGQMRLGLRDQITDTPVGLSFGLWGRMELSALVPFITTRAESQLRVNPTGREATVAFNPARTVAAALAANSLLLTQFDSATAQVNRRLTFCAANATSTGCAAVNASAATARAAVQDATNFATGVAALYGGRAGGRGAPFVPISGSAAQTAIDARIATFRTLFATFGSSALTSSGPFAAQVALTTADAATLLSDSAYGIGARALGTSVTRGLGDIEFGAKLKLFDTFGTADTLSPGFHLRQSVGVTYRLGTATLDRADDFTDLGTGQHQDDIELRAITDVGVGPRFSVTLFSRYNLQRADTRVMRIPLAADAPLAAAYRERVVQRDLGDELELAVSPRWKLNGSLALWGHYAYRAKAADAYSGAFGAVDLGGTAVKLNATLLDANTEEHEHRFGAGARFSTLAAYERGAARLPLEVSFAHYQSVAGSGGATPRLSVDQVRVTVYRRLFGR